MKPNSLDQQEKTKKRKEAVQIPLASEHEVFQIPNEVENENEENSSDHTTEEEHDLEPNDEPHDEP